MASFLQATREKLSLTYVLFAFTVVVAIASAYFAFLQPWSKSLVVFLALPANWFLNATAAMRAPGFAGEVLFFAKLVVVLLLSAAYLYLLASAALSVRDAIEPTARRR